MQGEAWVTAPAYFYGALLAGRLAASWTLWYVPDLTQARVSASLAVVSVVALLYTRTLSGVAITAALIGFGLSTLYPTAIGLASVALGPPASRVMGILFALSTLGGQPFPGWLVTSPPASAVCVPLCSSRWQVASLLQRSTGTPLSGIFGRDGKNAGTSGTTPEDSYKAASNAWATLMAGFTTVQSVGAPNDIPLRDEGLDVFVEQTTVTSINGAHAVRRIQSRDENHDGKRQKSDQDFCPDFEVCLPRDPSRPSLPDAPADIGDKQRRR